MNVTAVVLDNVPAHRADTCGRLLVKFLLAYSPFLNPTENENRSSVFEVACTKNSLLKLAAQKVNLNKKPVSTVYMLNTRIYLYSIS